MSQKVEGSNPLTPYQKAAIVGGGLSVIVAIAGAIFLAMHAVNVGTGKLNTLTVIAAAGCAVGAGVIACVTAYGYKKWTGASQVNPPPAPITPPVNPTPAPQGPGNQLVDPASQPAPEAPKANPTVKKAGAAANDVLIHDGSDSDSDVDETPIRAPRNVSANGGGNDLIMLDGSDVVIDLARGQANSNPTPTGQAGKAPATNDTTTSTPSGPIVVGGAAASDPSGPSAPNTLAVAAPNMWYAMWDNTCYYVSTAGQVVGAVGQTAGAVVVTAVKDPRTAVQLYGAYHNMEKGIDLAHCLPTEIDMTKLEVALPEIEKFAKHPWTGRVLGPIQAVAKEYGVAFGADSGLTFTQILSSTIEGLAVERAIQARFTAALQAAITRSTASDGGVPAEAPAAIKGLAATLAKVIVPSLRGIAHIIEPAVPAASAPTIEGIPSISALTKGARAGQLAVAGDKNPVQELISILSTQHKLEPLECPLPLAVTSLMQGAMTYFEADPLVKGLFSADSEEFGGSVEAFVARIIRPAMHSAVQKTMGAMGIKVTPEFNEWMAQMDAWHGRYEANPATAGDAPILLDWVDDMDTTAELLRAAFREAPQGAATNIIDPEADDWDADVAGPPDE